MINFFKKKNLETLNMDAWSDGQVGSKLWLCQNVERIFLEQNLPVGTIWIFGSWYGTLAYMLLARERLSIKKIVCFDTDKTANEVAEKMLDHWRHQGIKIEIYEQDCLKINAQSSYYKESMPDLIINTSCEHMVNYSWWEGLPTGTHFALQSTNMEHPTHINRSSSLDDFAQKISPAKFNFKSEKSFNYPTLKFNRFMLIGRKI